MNLLIDDCVLWPGGRGSVLVQGGVVSRVGPAGTLDAPEGAIKINAGGGTLLPGLVDTHCHPFELGWLKRNVDLRGVANVTALRLRVAAKVKGSRKGDWVAGMGWDQEAFPEGRMPTRNDLDDITQANPVILGRVCGHIGLLNSRAIEVLGLSGRTGDEYERDASGELTGIVKERALVDAYARMPGRTAAISADELLSAEIEAASNGVCTLHGILSPDGFKEELAGLVSLQSEGKLLLRHRLFIPIEALDYVGETDVKTKLQSEKVRLNGVKIYSDGSMGARTAALREPYSDDPGNSGLLRYSGEELTSQVVRADQRGYQVIVHAIGDRAVEQAVEALSVVTGARNPRRHRIEHASLLPRDLRAKMVKHSIRATVQPCFITSDTWALKRLGEERVGDLYPLKSMIEEGILASGGSDAPVETISPVIGIHAAMVRGDFAPKEKLTVQEAVELYTWKAWANGFESGDGTAITEGMPANLTLLDSDISALHPSMLRKVGVTATIVGGSVVHSSVGLPAPAR